MEAVSQKGDNYLALSFFPVIQPLTMYKNKSLCTLWAVKLNDNEGVA